MARTKKQRERIYFGEREERAVIDYLNAESKAEKDAIYDMYLRKPLKKMVECIVRKYGLYKPDDSFETIRDDTLSYLQTKMDKFNTDGTKKAYSYYGTTCKNYLINEIKKYNDELIKKPLLGEVSDEVTNSDRISSDYDKSAELATESIKYFIEKVRFMINEPAKYKLKESEIKMGNTLINLFENWDFVLSTDCSSKMNKSSILLFLKESTGMDAKGIRDNMKKFKKEYFTIKEKLID